MIFYTWGLYMCKRRIFSQALINVMAEKERNCRKLENNNNNKQCTKLQKVKRKGEIGRKYEKLRQKSKANKQSMLGKKWKKCKNISHKQKKFKELKKKTQGKGIKQRQ